MEGGVCSIWFSMIKRVKVFPLFQNWNKSLCAPAGVRRACCAWCPTSPPSVRAGAGCGSPSRCPSRWLGTTASSTPPHWPLPTRRSLGRGHTAAPRGPSCGPGTPVCSATAARRPAPASTAPTAPPARESRPHPPPLQLWSPNAHRGAAQYDMPWEQKYHKVYEDYGK